MANRYWVGGTAAWDGTAGTKWSLTSGGAGGQAVPTSADDVFFTNLSTGTCTISTGNTGAKSITCTGFTATLNINAAISVAGNITFVSGMTLGGSSRAITTTASSTLISGGKIFAITVSGGTLTQGDALNTVGFAVTVNSGAAYTTSASNFSLTCDTFSANGATVTLNASTVTVSTNWSITGGTLNAGTSTITCSFSGNNTFTGGGKIYNNVSFTNTGTNAITIAGANTFSNLTFPSPATLKPFRFSANQTITTMVCAGGGATSRLFLTSDTLGTARTLTITTWTTATDVDFRDITLTNAKSGTRLGNCGGNTNITFDAAKTVYWNLAGTQNWSATGWAATSGGSPATTNFPLAQDTAVFNNTGSVTGTITINAGWNVGTVDMSSRTTAMTLDFSFFSFNVYGNWLNGTGTTISGSTALVFAGRTTQTITSNGKSFSTPITGTGVSNTITLADALTTTDAVTLSGTTGLSLGSNTLTSATFDNQSTSSRTLALSTGSITITGSGASAFIVTSTGLTVTGSATISLTSASAKTFAGGGVNWGSTLNQGGAGALTITGANTFSNITNTYGATGATSILFTAGTTTTFSNWNASGTAGNLLTIGSVTAASHTLSKSSGTVNANYLSISRSTATGGATWNAGANSTNGGNNSGWIFGGGAGNFLMFF